MARKIRMTRPELKRQRDALARFTRYLPMLKLKQQQLQMTVREVAVRRDEARSAADAADGRIAPYRAVLADTSGVNVQAASTPEQIATHTENIAGVRIPVFDSVSFPTVEYSLFGTPPWVDQALADLRDLADKRARADVLDEQFELLQRALIKIIQRVNLFEKVLIPDARENIRVIRIHLGEEQTAAVGRAKLAKAKIEAQAGGVLMVAPDEKEEVEAAEGQA
ncbi:MAG: V-type ATP synthase subunit D [Planctomycetota bacterium]|jgi:V/A-type H+-transporting ATPase subunit D